MQDAIALNFESGNGRVGHNNISQNYGNVYAPITQITNITVIEKVKYTQGLTCAIIGVVIGVFISDDLKKMWEKLTKK